TETETTSFSIPKTDQPSSPKFVSGQPNLIFQGNAYSTDGKLILTEAKQNTVGRALYSAPIHIWDRKTGKVADFTASFTFYIRPNSDSQVVADGFTFFIAPVDTQPRGDGGLLGVFNREEYDPTIHTVAVEFDTFHNQPWDPDYIHIGVDINSIKSRITRPWNPHYDTYSIAYIAYKAATNELDVTVTYPNSRDYATLREVVDLKQIVPEWVRVGLSASTATYYSAHEVYSWSFHSELGGTSSSN
uniref:Lectin n=1 Tax=Lathyrus sphaericus TaxID=3861 RepID=LEC_LATSP|nr:RecName: Full=Lectin [Lathyrus sphaericus]prf//1307177A lectin [Lathyrus sphaericus]